MTDSNGPARLRLDGNHYLTFNVNHEEHYYETLKAAGVASGRSVNVHASAGGGGAAWEFVIEEVEFENDRTSTRMKMFDETFPAFLQVPELFVALARRQPKRIEDVVSILLSLGAVDTTDRQDPDLFATTGEQS